MEFPKTARILMVQAVMEEPRRELSQTELRCWDRKGTSTKHKGKDNKDKSGEKDKARSSSALEKYSGEDKGASSRDCRPSGS